MLNELLHKYIFNIKILSSRIRDILIHNLTLKYNAFLYILFKLIGITSENPDGAKRI